MTLTYELDLDILKTYLHIKNEVSAFMRINVFIKCLSFSFGSRNFVDV